MQSDQYIRENLARFKEAVVMPGGYRFDHLATLRRINLYYHGKFETGEYDSNGFKKYFYNITKPACDGATKFCDLDTKDIILMSDKPDEQHKIWMMQRDLKDWLKEEKFGVLLNEIVYDYPKYGSVVIKRNKKDKWKKMNLENLRMDVTSKTLDESPFVYEVHTMTRAEVKKMGWDKAKIDELLERSEDNAFITVYECYDYCDGGWELTIRGDIDHRRMDGKNQSIEAAGINSGQEDYYPSVILFESKEKELPYRELHWEKVPGRWLGFGMVEYLFDNQVRMNELVNVKAKGLYFTSLKIYQTQDDSVGKNILTDMENGDILKVTKEITPVVNEERNLAVFNQEEARWDTNTDRKAFSFDVVRGGELPSGTPLGVAQLTAGMVASYFEYKRENFGLFIKELILNDVLPSFKKSIGKDHVLKFTSSDKEITKLRQAIADAKVSEAFTDYIKKYNRIPSNAEVERERQRVMSELDKKSELFIDVPQGFYDVDCGIDVVVTGEQIDVSSKIQTLQAVMQIIGGNPAILQDKKTRTIFFKLLEMTGVSPIDLDLLEDQVGPMPSVPMPTSQQASIPTPQINQMIPAQGSV